MNIKTIGTAMMVLVATIFVFMGSATAAVDFVYPGESIQAAIDDAVDGDTIIIMDGDYIENVVVDKSVAVISYGMYQYYHAEGWDMAGFFWWVYYFDTWDYTYEYDGAVTVAAADDSLNVFTVTADDVLIMNIEVDYYDTGSSCYFWHYWFWWGAGCSEWEYIVYDNPMYITGAVRSDAAGIAVNGATNTELVNLVTQGNDNGIVLIDATNTYIEDVEMNGNENEGLVATGCDGIFMYDCVVVNSGKRGIEITDSANVEIDTVLVLDSNKNGIDLEVVDGVTLNMTVVDGGAKTGIKIDDCTDVNVLYSSIINNGRNGLTLRNCEGTDVIGNEIAFNDDYGLKTHNAFNVTIADNNVHDNDVDEKHFNSRPNPAP